MNLNASYYLPAEPVKKIFFPSLALAKIIFCSGDKTTVCSNTVGAGLLEMLSDGLLAESSGVDEPRVPLEIIFRFSRE